jgi:5-methyltetrahydrofolate--homocysteine methyltransferase
MDPYGIDYREFKKKFGGAVCLAGNIDIEFPLAHGTPAEVEKDVREHMEVMKPGGGYVACSSHSIVNYIPHENFTSMINAIHKSGRYEGGHWTFSGERGGAATGVNARAAVETKAKPAAGAISGAAAKEKNAAAAAPRTAPADHRADVKTKSLLDIFDAVLKGDHDKIQALVKKALGEGKNAIEVINEALTPAIKDVGDRFSTGELFLPDLLLSANTMQEAMKILAPLMEGDSRFVSKGKVVLGTIKGDLHDIGKNMVKALLKGNGFEVVDIGIDNGPEKFVDAIKKHKPDVVGYSGLLTTTLAGIPDQMEALRRSGLRDKVITIVGGAPVSREFAARNGVDLFGKDANEAVKVIEKALAAVKKE